tara:strand:+ start:4820 stop:5323 length:504 start_codon:yes stop_codon:yes gene_type:complete
MNQEKFKKKKGAFLDRDGVINLDTGYVHKIQDFRWIKGIKKTIKLLNKLNYVVVVITNQSGVKRGYFTEEELNKLHEWINQELKKNNAYIDDFFYCTDLPKENILKSRRKPSPEMINEAIKKYNLERNQCFFIGDKQTDLQAAKNARIKGFLFEGGDIFDMIQKILN